MSEICTNAQIKTITVSHFQPKIRHVFFSFLPIEFVGKPYICPYWTKTNTFVVIGTKIKRLGTGVCIPLTNSYCPVNFKALRSNFESLPTVLVRARGEPLRLDHAWPYLFATVHWIFWQDGFIICWSPDFRCSVFSRQEMIWNAFGDKGMDIFLANMKTREALGTW